MTPDEILSRVTRVGFDAAPIIYYVEGNEVFEPRCTPFFDAIDRGEIEGFTSSISLPETLVHPLRNGDTVKTVCTISLLLNGQNISKIRLYNDRRGVSKEIGDIFVTAKSAKMLKMARGLIVHTVLRENFFRDLLLHTQGMITLLLSVEIAETAARLRANYTLRTPDAVQIATAFHANCDIFLTNDDRLKQIREIEIVVIKELT